MAIRYVLVCKDLLVLHDGNIIEKVPSKLLAHIAAVILPETFTWWRRQWTNWDGLLTGEGACFKFASSQFHGAINRLIQEHTWQQLPIATLLKGESRFIEIDYFTLTPTKYNISHVSGAHKYALK